MNKQQFENLKVGDRCVMYGSRDKGIICEVRSFVIDSILVRPVGDSVFGAVGTYNLLRLPRLRELDIIQNKKTES